MDNRSNCYSYFIVCCNIFKRSMKKGIDDWSQVYEAKGAAHLAECLGFISHDEFLELDAYFDNLPNCTKTCEKELYAIMDKYSN